jgi:predicted nucleic acid-binding protein
MSAVLVDSSIWIDFCRYQTFAAPLDSLIKHGCACVCGLVKSEILPFSRKREAKLFQSIFEKMRYLSFFESSWDVLIQIQSKIIEAGHNPLSISDAILVVLCREFDCQLFTKDKDFFRIKDVVGLELYDWKV